MSLVFSWRARQMLRRRTSNAERAPPPFLNSLAALQEWLDCPQIRHRGAQERRCSVSAQRWSAGVTPPPLIARTNRKRLLLSPNKCSRIDASPCFACPTRRNKIALERCSSNAKNPIVFTPRFAHRAHINRTSHVLFYLHIASP
jgi:hypothetical protein